MRPRVARLAVAIGAAVLVACGDGGTPAPVTGEPITTEPATGEEFDREAAEARAADLLGRAEEEVAGLPDVRVAERDGESMDVTADLMPGRMNVTVEDGIVVDVSFEEDHDPPS